MQLYKHLLQPNLEVFQYHCWFPLQQRAKLVGIQKPRRCLPCSSPTIPHYDEKDVPNAEDITLVARSLIHLDKYQDANDMILSAISEDEKAKWIKACEPVVAAWIEQVKAKGLDGAKLIAEARALVAKHDKA